VAACAVAFLTRPSESVYTFLETIMTAAIRRPGDGPQLVYQELRRGIIEKQLVPGERLPEGALATRFGVSRTVVRAALERLVAEGLAERVNNRSARVASLGRAAAADLLDVRIKIETLVVERLAGQILPDTVQVLSAHVAREEKVSSLRQPEAVRLSGEFHVLLAEATGSALLTRYVSDLVSRSSLVLAGQNLPHSSSCAVREHLLLIEHLQAGRLEEAKAAMSDHLRQIGQRARICDDPTQ
jgi:DNA-binding GntR family transcriptional regulator